MSSIEDAIKQLEESAGKLKQLSVEESRAVRDAVREATKEATSKVKAEYKDKKIWWLGQDTEQLTMPESFKVIAAASYDYTAVVEGIISKREAKVLGGENIPMNFANGGFVYQFNDKVGSVLTPDIRKAVNAALKDMKAGKLKLDWKVEMK